MTVSFLNESGDTEKWEFGGGSWAVGGFSQVGAGKLTELDNKINLYFTYEEGVGVIGKDGEVLESFTSFHYKVTPIYYCKQGDVFRYKGNNADSAIACAFYYNNKFVSYLQTGNINEFTDIVIGEGINGVKFASFNSISKDVILEVKSSYFLARENSIEDLENNIAKNAQSINETKLYLENNRFPIILEIEKGIGFVDTSGNINPQESFSYKKTQKIPCKKGDVFLYKGHGETQGVSALFYKDNDIISNLIISSRDSYTEINIEEGINYVTFASLATTNNPDKVILDVKSRTISVDFSDIDDINFKLKGGEYNYNYTGSDCIFLNKGLTEDGKEISYQNCTLSDFLPIEGFNSITWNQPNGKNGAYKICFYRNSSEDGFIKTFSSTELSEINTDEDITENVPSESKYLRFTTFNGWNPIIKINGTNKGLERKLSDMTASDVSFEKTATLEAENLQKAIEILSLRISNIGSTKKVINRGINFIGHSIWQNNGGQDKFADNQTLKGYQPRILERFEFTNGWRQHVVSGSHLRTANFLANVAKLDAKENDIWTLDTFVNEGYNENGVGTYDDFLVHDMDSDVTTLTYMGALGRFAKIVEEKSGQGAIIIASDNLFAPHTSDNLRHDNLAALIEVCKRQGWYFCSQMTQSGFNQYNYTFLTMNGGYVEGKYPVDSSIYEGDGIHPNNVGYSLAVRPWLQILEEIWFRDNQL